MLTRSAIILFAATGFIVAQTATRQDRVDEVFAKSNSGASQSADCISRRHPIKAGLRAAAILLLAQDGRLSLDDDVHQYITGLPDFRARITVRPGEKHPYSNTGYTLLGQIVKRISGQPLRDFTTERIFKPLGMKSSHFRDDHTEIVIYGPAGKRYRLSVTNFHTMGTTSLLTTVAS